MTIALDIPSPCRDQLTFAETSVTGLEEWVSALPMVHIGGTVKQIYQALLELNELKTLPHTRMQMLEVVRPAAHHLLSTLSRSYLNHNSTADNIQHQIQISDLAQALQHELSTGYKMVFAETLTQQQQMTVSSFNDLLGQSIHRAMTEIGLSILRACQLYTTTTEGVWQELYLLFRYAQRFKLLKQQTSDPEKYFKQRSSIEEAFKQVLLLACAKPNQLRPIELDRIYKTLELWSDGSKLIPSAHKAALFVLNSQHNQPPIYKQNLKGELSKQHIGLFTEQLAHYIYQHLKAKQQHQDSNLPIQIPNTLSVTLLKHLIFCWSKPSKRNSDRTPTNGIVTICFGFENIYQHLEKGIGKIEQYPVDEAQLINASVGGYCIQSYDQNVFSVETSALIGIQETDKIWRLGIVRWIKNSDDFYESQLGIQTLAEQVTCCQIRILENADYNEASVSVFFIPELSAMGIQANIITPSLSIFSEKLKVELDIHGELKHFSLSNLVERSADHYRFEALALSTDIE